MGGPAEGTRDPDGRVARTITSSARRIVGIAAVAFLTLGLETVAVAAGTPYTHAIVAGTGLPRRTFSGRDAKVDSQPRRLFAPETVPGAPSPTFAPRAGAWRHGDVVRVQVVLSAGSDPSVLTQRGPNVERTVGDVVEGSMPVSALAAFAESNAVRALRVARPGRHRATTSDAATRANLARAMGVDGRTGG